MGNEWGEQVTFEMGYDIVDAAWDPSGRHVVLECYKPSSADEDDEHYYTKRILFVARADNGEIVWSRACGPMSPSVSPDGLLIAHLDRNRHLLVRDLISAKVLVEIDSSRLRSAVVRVYWIGDSAHIAVQTASETRILDARSGSTRWMAIDESYWERSSAGGHFAVTWDLDGWDEPSEVEIVDVKSFSSVYESTAHSPRLHWSADGEKVAIENSTASPTLRVVSLTSGKVIIEVPMKVGSIAWSPDSHRLFLCRASYADALTSDSCRLLDFSAGDPVQRRFSLENVSSLEVDYRFKGMSWSPDSRHIALEEFSNEGDDVAEWSHKCRVLIFDTNTSGSFEEIPDAVSFYWSPDGDKGMPGFDAQGVYRAEIRTVSDPVPLLVIEGSDWPIWDTGIQDWPIRSDLRKRCFALLNTDRSALDLWDPWGLRRMGSIPFTPDVEGNMSPTLQNIVWSPDGDRLLIRRTKSRAEIWGRVDTADSPAARSS